MGGTGGMDKALRCPHPLDSLCQANIIRFEFIKPYSHQECCTSKPPPEESPRPWQSFAGYIVDDNRPNKLMSIPFAVASFVVAH